MVKTSTAAVSYQLRQVEDVGDGGAYSDPAGQVPHGGSVGGHPVAPADAAQTDAGLTDCCSLNREETTGKTRIPISRAETRPAVRTHRSSE